MASQLGQQSQLRMSSPLQQQQIVVSKQPMTSYASENNLLVSYPPTPSHPIHQGSPPTNAVIQKQEQQQFTPQQVQYQQQLLSEQQQQVEQQRVASASYPQQSPHFTTRPNPTNFHMGPNCVGANVVMDPRQYAPVQSAFPTSINELNVFKECKGCNPSLQLIN